MVKLHSELLGNEKERSLFCEIPDLSHPQSTNLVTTAEFFAILLRFLLFAAGLKSPARPFRINYFSFSVEQIKGGSEETLITNQLICFKNPLQALSSPPALSLEGILSAL